MEKGYRFLFWAYNIIWLGIVVYTTFLVVKLAHLRERVDRLEKKIGGEGRARVDQ